MYRYAFESMFADAQTHTHTLYTRRNVSPADMKTLSRYLKNVYATNSDRAESDLHSRFAIFGFMLCFRHCADTLGETAPCGTGAVPKRNV